MNPLAFALGKDKEIAPITNALHGEFNKIVPDHDDIEKASDMIPMESMDEGVKRNVLYSKIGRMLAKGDDIDKIKKRYKDIDDTHPGHIEKIVQALKDRNEIPFKEDESISEIDHMRKLAGVMSQTPKAKKKENIHKTTPRSIHKRQQ